MAFNQLVSRSNTFGSSHQNSAAPKMVLTELPNPPKDSISSLSFSTASNTLAGSSWDGTISAWNIRPNPNYVYAPGSEQPTNVPAFIGETAFTAGQSGQSPPLLTCSWWHHEPMIVTGSADHKVSLHNIQTNQTTQLGMHNAPVSCSRALSFPSPMVVTSSWDKTIKYWDGRSPDAVSVVQVPERVYLMDVRDNLLAVSLANQQILVFDMTKSPNTPAYVLSPTADNTDPKNVRPAPINHYANIGGVVNMDLGARRQHSALAILRNNCLAYGTIEARVAIHYLDPAQHKANGFTFRCHRVEPPNSPAQIFAVNSISVHQTHGTFVTCGSDGTYATWDKDSKTRLYRSQVHNSPFPPITASAINAQGNMLAFAAGDDWSQGYDPARMAQPVRVIIHHLIDSQVVPRKKP
ncbi:hypothetical protein H696_01200 [Fonticula alba]|uniref:Uncharacterized protein n=1 Tax=Fonticula alba TaxID=691883 RepID=A0A058ZCX7_FONAL|nr:hypothetical protein H696_01200 [Fonticula alba]KCV71783.1 hypothetical protein H696_01200 [Fonticula alba]|eukprot:XP_009493361.1 hypothetical protein H696_01200 [Fonticula alba]